MPISCFNFRTRVTQTEEEVHIIDGVLFKINLCKEPYKDKNEKGSEIAKGEHFSSHVWLHAEWHLAPILAGYSWPRKESSTHLDLCIRTITQLKDKILDKHRQDGLLDAISAPVSKRYRGSKP